VKLNLTPFRKFRSIGVRISQLLAVTLLTLGLYVVVYLPAQKKDLLEALKSKPRRFFLLQDVTAGAAMSEDYSRWWTTASSAERR